jgi:integrase
MSSLVYQIETAFRVITRFGESRHAAKRRGDAGQYIFSFKTLAKYLGIANDFVAWCQVRYTLKRLGQLTPEMARAFIEERQGELLASGRRRSPNTINSYCDAINKLDEALRAKGWRRENAPPLVDKSLRPKHGPPRPTPFSDAQAQEVMACLKKHPDPRVALVAEAMEQAGLRLDEAVRLRVSEIREDHLSLDGHACKNGRPREIPLSEEVAAFFAELKRQAGDRPLVFETAHLRRLVQRAVWRAAEELGITDHRSHNFRSKFANKRYRQLKEELPERQAKREVASELGHGRTTVLRSYCG